MKSRLNRRKFLAGAGVVIGLPYLESLESRASAAVSCDSRQRFIAGFLPCGIHMPDFTPTTAGKGWVAPYILSPFADAKLLSKISIITGIDYQDTAEPADPPGGHGSGTGAFLTLRPVNGNLKDPNRTSIDQRIATETAACKRPLASLQLGIKTLGDGCDSTSCNFLENISWTNDAPNPNVTDPVAAFNRIFTGFMPMAAGAAPPAVNVDAERRKFIRTSILDQVLGEATSLQTVLGKNDKLKVDELMSSIRELETRIQNLDSSGGGGGGMCVKPGMPTLTATSPYKDLLPVMLDLAVLALQCDVTRVLTFMFARGSSMVDFAFLPSIGTTTLHHTTSHHGSDQTKIQKLREIGKWEMLQWANFLTKLDAITEPNGKTLLDNSLAYLNSEISDGDAHRKYDMPVVLAGTAGGKLKVDGTHYNYYPNMTFPRENVGGRSAAQNKGLGLGPPSPLTKPTGGAAPTGVHGSKLFVSMMNAFGIADQTFGIGGATGPLPEIMV
jgi:hypothetical protein